MSGRLWYSVEVNGRPQWFGMTDMTPEEVRAYYTERWPHSTIGRIEAGS